ncbi:MAG: hypothetical protein HUU46_07995 [Candidatus Hydrogenedentes bacterium]|nr:hypothetical protein [Candidatus Hydrogenedentota bacterium]
MERFVRISAALGIAGALLLSAANAELTREDGAKSVRQKRMHCGVAAMETILRFCGETSSDFAQDRLGLRHNARIAEYKLRYPQQNFVEQNYPAYESSEQPIMMEMLIDDGFCVISTRSSLNKDGSEVLPQVAALMEDQLRAQHWMVIHVEAHYVAISAFDEKTREVMVNDPNNPVFRNTLPLETVADPNGKWIVNSRLQVRKGWNGRFLAFWRPKDDAEKQWNAVDTCPVCREVTAGQTHQVCAKCRVYIDRRKDRSVQRGLDAIARAAGPKYQWDVSLGLLRRFRVGDPEVKDISEDAWRQALVCYPLYTKEKEKIETLARYASRAGLDLSALKTKELEQVVTSGNRWYGMLMRYMEQY